MLTFPDPNYNPAWSTVGGIIASDSKFTEGVHLRSGRPNVVAFDRALDNLTGGSATEPGQWNKDYRYVRFWREDDIDEAIAALTTYPNLDAIVVTGTTLGEAVMARRPARAPWWIVVATDDGSWTDQFQGGKHNTQQVTGKSSFFTWALKEQIEKGAESFHKRHKDTPMVVAAVMADDALLSPAAQAEKQYQFNAIPGFLSAPDRRTDSIIRVSLTSKDDEPTAFGVSDLPDDVNAIVILGDATTFLARTAIRDKFQDDHRVKLAMVEHKLCRWTKAKKKSRHHGPDMPSHYRTAAGMVHAIIGKVDPGDPPNPVPGSPEDDDDDED